MRRREEELVQRYGRPRYEAAYGSNLWSIYVMLGKLCPTEYYAETNHDQKRQEVRSPQDSSPLNHNVYERGNRQHEGEH